MPSARGFYWTSLTVHRDLASGPKVETFYIGKNQISAAEGGLSGVKVLTLRFSVSSVVRISENIPLCLGISIPYIIYALYL